MAMLQARLLNMALIGLAVCSCLPGCSGGGDNGPVTKANFEKIKIDGTQDLAAVESIMGGKGTDLPEGAWNEHGINPKALPGRGGGRGGGGGGRGAAGAGGN